MGRGKDMASASGEVPHGVSLLRMIAKSSLALAACFLSIMLAAGFAATLPEEFFYKPGEAQPAKKTGTASKPASKPAAGAARKTSSGRFSKDAEGVITDSRTGLQWFVGPDHDMTWVQANSWAQGLSAGGGGWRLPTLAELQGLYGSGEYTIPGKKYILRIDPIFAISACCPWSGDLKEPMSAGYMLFNGGGTAWGNRNNISADSRVIAVRNRR
ncbi:DUF1566 domain-containing protein [Desulfolutivibrio sulfoxidireducens]|nr:DUF1566 domain-containing protein [Desulfolutivibrio sulfoxidireducens]QLA18351.1 DUF1566 domain-containing protein [Desulfolutivibrio sulfoxidireducens]